MRDVQSKKYLTVAAASTVGILQFQVRICHARVTDEQLHVLQTSSGLLIWKGTHCVSLQLNNMELEMIKAIEFFQSLPLMDTQ